MQCACENQQEGNSENSISTGQTIDDGKFHDETASKTQQNKLVKCVQWKRKYDSTLHRQQLRNAHLSLVSKDILEGFSSPWHKISPQTEPSPLTGRDFPIVGDTSGFFKTHPGRQPCESLAFIELSHRRPKRYATKKISIANFLESSGKSCEISEPNTAKQCQAYFGNSLDSDLPERKRGIHCEVPKEKKPTNLKLNILNERLDKEKSVEVYADNAITEELNENLKIFIEKTANLQDKMYKRDPIKGFARRRYVLGFREAKKLLNLHRIKIVIIAPDLKDYIPNGAVENAIKEVIYKANYEQVPFVYGLTSRLIGKLAMKHAPASCIAITSYEGVEEQWYKLIDIITALKRVHEDSTDDASKTEPNPMNEANLPLLINLMEALRD